MAAANSSSPMSSARAGSQRTASSSERPSDPLVPRRAGTKAPRASIRTASRATRPSQVTLVPTPLSPRPPLTATSQPSASLIGMDRASACMSAASETAGCWFQPSAGPPIASSRSASSSMLAGAVPGPAGPDHQLAGRPGGLEADLARRVGDEPDGGDLEHRILDLGSGRRRFERADQFRVGGLQRGQLLAEVGDHLLTFGTGQAPDRGQALVGVVQQRLERPPPGARIGIELRLLVSGGHALRGRPDGGLQRSCDVIHWHCGAPRTEPPPPTRWEPSGCRALGAARTRHAPPPWHHGWVLEQEAVVDVSGPTRHRRDPPGNRGR